MFHDVSTRERDFHDSWAASTQPSQVPVRAAWESAAAPENRLIRESLKPTPHPVLDLGCGCGEASAYLSTLGYHIIASDSSLQMVKLAMEVTRRFSGREIVGVVCSADHLPFKDQCLGVVYGANVLHHTDSEAAVRESHRVLVDGGQAFFWDPVAHNPLINVYRILARKVRTPDEHPLTMSRIHTLSSIFRKNRVEYRWLTNLSLFLHFFFIQWINPNKIRYWKHVLEKSEDYDRFLRRCEALDRSILRGMPWLRRYCWNVILLLQK